MDHRLVFTAWLRRRLVAWWKFLFLLTRFCLSEEGEVFNLAAAQVHPYHKAAA